MGKRRRHRSRDSFWTQQYGGMPAWGIGLAAVAMLLIAGITFLNLPSAPATAGSNREPRPLPTMHDPDAGRTDVLLVGDSYTFGSPMGGMNYTGWPAALARENDWKLYKYADGGAGYVQKGGNGTTFGSQIDTAINAGVTPELLIIEGGRNDRFVAEDVPAAATDALSAARNAWPDAEILVIGPIWTDTEPGPEMFDIRDAVASAAADIDASVTDPLEDRWLMDDAAEYVGEDLTHPTDEGHTYLGERITAALTQAGIEL